MPYKLAYTLLATTYKRTTIGIFGSMKSLSSEGLE